MTRRSEGLYRRRREDGSPGAWVLDIVIRGRRYVRTFDRALNRTLAREKAAEARRKILDGEDERKPTPELKEYATQWLQDVAGELERKTLSRYRQDLEGHVLPALGKLQLPNPVHRLDGKGRLDEECPTAGGFIVHETTHVRPALTADRYAVSA